MRRPTREEVTAAILSWLRARERAEQMRTISAALAQAAEYGCPIHARPAHPSCPAMGLVDAERPIALLTSPERRLLVERYWRDFRMVEVEREIAPGVRAPYLRAAFQDDRVVARRLGVGVATLRKRLGSVREKVRAGIMLAREAR